jgi:hypothetical protein
MLPTRKSSPVRRSETFAIQVRVPVLGLSFPANAAAVRADGVFLATFMLLEPATEVIVDVYLPDGRAEIDGVVVAKPDGAQGIAVDFHGVDDEMRARLDALGAPETLRSAPPESGSDVSACDTERTRDVA